MLARENRITATSAAAAEETSLGILSRRWGPPSLWGRCHFAARVSRVLDYLEEGVVAMRGVLLDVQDAASESAPG
jgi:hypothetical protein